MLKQSKFISQLDLKYLDMRYLTLQKDSSFNISSIRHHNRSIDLSSLLQKDSPCKKSISFDTTGLQESLLNITSSKKSPKQLKTCPMNHRINQNNNEIQKYRRKIEKVKKQNSAIHQQIIKLYKDKDFQCQTNKCKPIKTLKIYQQPDISMKRKTYLQTNILEPIQTNKTANFPNLKRYFYENLYDSGDQIYKNKLEELKKQFVSNSMHKDFEGYLHHKNIRVPAFMKRIK